MKANSGKQSIVKCNNYIEWYFFPKKYNDNDN